MPMYNNDSFPSIFSINIRFLRTEGTSWITCIKEQSIMTGRVFFSSSNRVEFALMIPTCSHSSMAWEGTQYNLTASNGKVCTGFPSNPYYILHKHHSFCRQAVHRCNCGSIVNTIMKYSSASLLWGVFYCQLWKSLRIKHLMLYRRNSSKVGAL